MTAVPIRVAIVHYHLAAGGVTRVIEAAAQVLDQAGICHTVLTGETVEGLGYLHFPGTLTGEQLAENLRTAAAERLGAAPDVWHFHNHSLGKNCLLPVVISLFAEAGERLVLQIHDLAEQGRAADYRAIADHPKLYPVAPQLHYAFLNSRDVSVFLTAGLSLSHVTLLANPVAASLLVSTPAASPILFAPIRGIRRKNLGELVFLAALAPVGSYFAISRAPENPTARPIHDTWQKFAKKHQLPIEFDVVDRFSPVAGASASFESWVCHSTHFVTTSVSEGFGLPWLEAAALGKPLFGRNLAHLAADHARHGICAGDLYDRILIPLDWVDLALLRDHLVTSLERNFRAYGRPLTQEILAATLEALVDEGWLDFGNLSEPLQQGVIERLADPADRQIPLVQCGSETQPVEHWLAAAVAQRNPTATASQLAPYSLAVYQASLSTLYSQLVEQPIEPVRYLDPEKILSAYLTPASFHFLLSALPTAVIEGKFRAVIFDIYGTLLDAAAGGVKPDALADPLLRQILREHGHTPPSFPSSELHAAVLRHHAAAGVPFPEIDLRVLWREILALPPDTDLVPLVQALEAGWHPATLMAGAQSAIQQLARSGISLGLLSNAQCNTLSSLGGLEDFFAPELTLLSYQQGVAKPAPVLFQRMAERLAYRGISPAETLYIGNDLQHDILPAAAVGFRTALFSQEMTLSAADLIIPTWVGFQLPGHSKKSL
jgi:FMN phosphatase YigB (HAD superfamily)